MITTCQCTCFDELKYVTRTATSLSTSKLIMILYHRSGDGGIGSSGYRGVGGLLVRRGIEGRMIGGWGRGWGSWSWSGSGGRGSGGRGSGVGRSGVVVGGSRGRGRGSGSVDREIEGSGDRGLL